jgi:hypothetical protein
VVLTSLEPFLRIGHVDGRAGSFGRVSALIELGPDALWGPFVDPRGSVALRVGGGALF